MTLVNAAKAADMIRSATGSCASAYSAGVGFRGLSRRTGSGVARRFRRPKHLWLDRVWRSQSRHFVPVVARFRSTALDQRRYDPHGILDPKTLEPVGPGETGEIVFTTMDREASPVVRWRTRDLVRLADDPYGCGCGRRGLPLIGRIIGRSDDMLKVRGSMVFPSQIEDCIASLDATVNEAWQIYIDREDRILEEIVVAVERRNDAVMDADAVRKALESAIRSRIGVRVNVEVHPEGVLPRYEAKAVRVIVRK